MRLLNAQTQYEFSADRFAALTQKYAGSGPRYTSYPTALEFKKEFNSEDFLEHVRISNENPIPSDLSLYFHMPFCRHLCFYCGCNKIVTKNNTKKISMFCPSKDPVPKSQKSDLIYKIVCPGCQET